MSGKSIKSLQVPACYYAVDPDKDSSDKLQQFFSRLFPRFSVHEELSSWLECSDDADEASAVMVLDLRGDITYFRQFLSDRSELAQLLFSRVVLALCERDQGEKISQMALEGFLPQHIVLVPWKHGVLERVINDLREHLLMREKPSRNTRNTIQHNQGSNREYMEKLNAANSFYADRARMMHMDSGRLLRLVKNIAQEEIAKEIPSLGRLLQYAEVLDQEVDELLKFSTQNWHTYQHQTTLDINTVLDTVSSTAIPFLKEHGIELIFEVNNNVPARLRGYPLGMTNALVNVLEMIAQTKVQGELVMRLLLEEHNKDAAVLYVQFMQSHYRGSMTNIAIETIRKNQKFDKLLEQMDEIEGFVLHAEEESHGGTLQLGFAVHLVDRRSYRLPSKTIMDKSFLIIDDRKKNAEILQKMLQYFHIASRISSQLDEALSQLQEHVYDVVIVTEHLAKRCTKSCKQIQKHEKFIVVNTEKGITSSYLGLDLADSFLNEPYTHKGIFNAIVDIFSDESVEGRMEDLMTLKSYLSLLGKNRRMVYLGSNSMTVHSLEVFLEDTGMELETVQNPQNLSAGEEAYDFVFISVDTEMLRTDMPALKSFLEQGKTLSRDGRVVCVVPEELQEDELDKIAPLTFVITYLQEPIDPEAFYKVLLDWVFGA